MPSGLGHAPRALPAGTASGSFRAGHSSQLPEARRAHARLQIAAAAVRPWPWRSMTTETSIPSIREGIKLLISPDASPPATTRPSHASKQAQPTSVWHAVNLQQNSMTSAAGATLGTSSNAVEAFKVETPQQLQDVLNCLVLAETVYKVQEGNHADVANTVSALRQDFPAALVSLEKLQWSLPHVPHRYLLAESKDALYAAFIGTKQRRDIMTNANIMQEAMWHDPADVIESMDEQDVPSAHTGFLNRARGVPIESLYRHATRLNKRLVLTGHSLGGAVALLCTLDLLHSLGPEAKPKLACVGFATPAVGNAALVEHAKTNGWDSYVTNYLVPEDVITRLIPPQVTTPVQSADQMADQACGPAHPALWASLAEQPASPSSSPPGSPTSTSSSSASSSGREPFAAESPVSPCSTSFSRDTIGPMRAAALSNRPKLPLRFRTAHGNLRVNKHNAKTGSFQQLPWHSQLPAASSLHAASNIPVGGSDRRSRACAANNIVPLHRLALLSNGSKLMSNSLPSNSITKVALKSKYSGSQLVSNTCTSVDQCDIGSSQSNHDLYSEQQQQQQSSAMPGTGLWNRTTQLAKLVSFPVRVTRAYYSYVPLGQQLYLNPQSVATSLHTPNQPPRPLLDPEESMPSAVATAEEEAAASAVQASGQVMEAALAQLARAASVPDVLAEIGDSVVLQRKEQLGRLWMHRMPTYRARFQQIFFAALGLPLPILRNPAPAASDAQTGSSALSQPIAPAIHVVSAETSAGALLASHHLKDMLKGSVHAVAEQTRFRWFWIWSGVWPAIRSRLHQAKQDITLQIAVRGIGLEDVDSVQASFETELLTTRIAKSSRHAGQSRQSLGMVPRDSALLQATLALLLTTKRDREITLEVVLPARLVQRARAQLEATGSLGLQITVQSDFCSAVAPVMFHTDKYSQPLHESFAGMLAVCRLATAMLTNQSRLSGQ